MSLLRPSPFAVALRRSRCVRALSRRCVAVGSSPRPFGVPLICAHASLSHAVMPQQAGRGCSLSTLLASLLTCYARANVACWTTQL